MPNRIQNHLAAVRHRRGIGAAELARRAGVSRATIYAIESGAYVPNTEVTLNLAQELEVTVEELFSLERESQRKTVEPVAMEVLSANPGEGQPVRIARLGTKWFGAPVAAAPYFFPECDGVISRVDGRMAGQADVAAFDGEQTFEKRLIAAGCDPATGLLARMVEKAGGPEVVVAAASSELSLRWLKEGKIHVAGSHIEDPATGEFNLPFVKRNLPGDEFTVIAFAQWDEGWVTAAGNPKGIRKVEDLARKNVNITNRQVGSGSRMLLDRLLRESGVPVSRVKGYDRVAQGHLAAAYTVASQEADCCLSTRSAARAFGMDFVPLRAARYDFVMRKATLELPAMKAFLDVLQKGALRRMLESVAGYDTMLTGSVRM
jgi:molybdate-binding protein/DNA-binding XRE family transcriptional regulator